MVRQGILGTPKAQPIKEKNYKLTLSKYKLCPIKRTKNKPYTGRKYLPITNVTEDLTWNIQGILKVRKQTALFLKMR